MPRSEIIKAVVEGETDLSKSLLRLQVIASDIHNGELGKWAENELAGYSSEEELPPYRCAKSLTFSYSGINNGTFKVNNAPLNPAVFEESTLDAISTIRFPQGVSALEGLLDGSESMVYVDRSFFAPEVERRSEGGIQCVSIKQGIPVSFLQDALAEIRNRVLKALLKLEEEYGNLDNLGVDISRQPSDKVARVNHEINSGVLQLHIEAPTPAAEPIMKKVAWNVVVPIITTIVGAVAGAFIVHIIGV